MSKRLALKTKKLINDPVVVKACNRSILITGSARSGTTILGKIVHSFKDVEYRFEPGMLFWLFALLPSLPRRQWKLLYEAYLFDEILIQSLCGRAINTNLGDDSSIYRVKSEREIKSRLIRSISQAEAVRSGSGHRVAYKLPNIVPFLPILRRYYPEMSIVIMVRKAPDVLDSILKKRWFCDESLPLLSSTWPSRIWKKIWVPFWVLPGDEERWVRMDELHRAAYYYILSNRNIRRVKNRIIVRYEDLISEPVKTTHDLAHGLGLMFGAKTFEILRSVKRTQKERDPSILDKLEPVIRKEVLFYSEQS